MPKTLFKNNGLVEKETPDIRNSASAGHKKKRTPLDRLKAFQGTRMLFKSIYNFIAHNKISDSPARMKLAHNNPE